MKKQMLPVTWRIPAKGCSIGSWLTISSLATVEIMATSGFEWLAIDMEHSALTIAQTEKMIRCVHLYGLPALVRVGANNPLLIKQAMDNGASGVIVPMINTPQDAQKAVAATFYPPRGKRGVGLSRAQGYGRNFKEYSRWINRCGTVIVQIEHIDAVDNIEAIISVEGVSGMIVGPYDLSASLGLPGEFSHPKVVSALNKIKRAMNQSSKPFGFHVVNPDVKEALGRIKEGYRFMAFGVDFTFLGEICSQRLGELHSRQKGRH